MLFNSFFAPICSKGKLGKAAGAEVCGENLAQNVHAIVARKHILISIVRNKLRAAGDSWKLRCRKSVKTVMIGAERFWKFQSRMRSTRCWHEASMQVKNVETQHVREVLACANASEGTLL